jgi:hypothetical protein
LYGKGKAALAAGFSKHLCNLDPENGSTLPILSLLEKPLPSKKAKRGTTWLAAMAKGLKAKAASNAAAAT